MVVHSRLKSGLMAGLSGLYASRKTRQTTVAGERGLKTKMYVSGEDVDSVNVNVWVSRRVMSAAKIAAILNSQTPSQLMEDILLEHLKRSGYLDNRTSDSS